MNDIAWQCEERLRAILKELQEENRKLKRQLRIYKKSSTHEPKPQMARVRVQEAREV